MNRQKTVLRFFLVFLSQAFIAFGVSLFRIAKLGADPYHAVIIATADLTRFPLMYVSIFQGLFFFIFQLIWGRKYIGIGTIANLLTVGFWVTQLDKLLHILGAQAPSFSSQLVFLLLGILSTALGLAIYQGINLGISAYDALPLMLKDRFPQLPYFALRMFFDISMAVIAYFLGGLIALGTVTIMLGLGPVVDLWTLVFRKLKFSVLVEPR